MMKAAWLSRPSMVWSSFDEATLLFINFWMALVQAMNLLSGKCIDSWRVLISQPRMVLDSSMVASAMNFFMDRIGFLGRGSFW
jgi:hypothetical protein